MFCAQHSIGGRLFVDAAMRMPRFQPFVDHALLVASLVSLVLFLQWPVTFEVMLPSPFAWFIVMLMNFCGYLGWSALSIFLGSFVR